MRQQIAQFAIEAAAEKYNGLRSMTRRLKGLPPGPEASIGKMVSTELLQRMTKFVGRMLGQYALLEHRTPFAPDEAWLRRILYPRIAYGRRRHHCGAEEHDRRAYPATAQGLAGRASRVTRSPTPVREHARRLCLCRRSTPVRERARRLR